MSTTNRKLPEAGAVIDRMKEALNVPTDAALAEMLATSRSRISKWRTRGSVPYEEAIYLALRFDISLDFLLTGRRESRQAKEAVDFDLLAEVFSATMRRVEGATISRSQWARTAREIAEAYGHAQQMVTRFMDTDGLSSRAARAAAVAAVEAISEAKKRQGPQ
jgi:transcriptional regulator with XRE-family HTH domain